MTDSKERNLVCPRDGTPLDARVYEADIEVDSCGSCRGMWLDKGEIEEIEDSKEHDWREELEDVPDDAAASVAMAEQFSQPRIPCPLCGTTMDTREYAYCSQIVVDTCPEGCGIWLDEGEVQAIEKFFERARKAAADDSASGPGLWASMRTLFGKG